VTLAIRRATPADADALSRISRRTFTATFGHLYPDEDLQAFLTESHAPDVCVRILADDAYAIWLLEDGADVVGYAMAGPCGLPHPDVAPGDGELKRLYVLDSVQNSGWGGRLFQVALDWLERAYRERNYRMAWLKVDPAFDPLRRTRRFHNLLSRVGLA